MLFDQYKLQIGQHATDKDIAACSTDQRLNASVRVICFRISGLPASRAGVVARDCRCALGRAGRRVMPSESTTLELTCSAKRVLAPVASPSRLTSLGSTCAGASVYPAHIPRGYCANDGQSRHNGKHAPLARRCSPGQNRETEHRENGAGPLEDPERPRPNEGVDRHGPDCNADQLAASPRGEPSYRRDLGVCSEGVSLES